MTTRAGVSALLSPEALCAMTERETVNRLRFVRLMGATLCLGALPLARAGKREPWDEGDYLILHARYGTAHSHVDVSAQLRRLARRDGRFQVNNEILGVDPDPGQRKTLRIMTRDREGQRRLFEYAEYSLVDGSNFIGWRQGDWGHGEGGGWDDSERREPGPHMGGRGQDDGRYEIVRAIYGTERQQIEVTQELRRVARRDRRVRVGNELFGGADPAPGRRKTLWLETRTPGGRQRRFEYEEGSWVDGDNFLGWGAGGPWRADDSGPPRPGHRSLRIISARYGEGGRSTDVSDLLRARIQRNSLRLRVDNGSLGGDPAPGRRKQLTLTYAFEGEDIRQLRVDEGEWLTLP